MNRFILDGRYGDLLSFFGISMEAALKKAQLPTDTFKRRNPTMTEEQYFRFMDAVGFLTTDPQMPIQIATTNKIESFSPPIFAAWCSPNGKVCIDRLTRYKRLIGPMIFEVEDVGVGVVIAIPGSGTIAAVLTNYGGVDVCSIGTGGESYGK